MSILWVTTFSADLWPDSAKLLVKSFRETMTPGTLVAYAEGMDVPPVRGADVLTRRLDKQPVLREFLSNNADVIPASLGGKLPAPECKCPGGPLDVHARTHTLPCVGYWFCKNASRWFRKPLAAHLAATEFAPKGYTHLIWVDADALFKRAVPPDKVKGWFPPGTGCIYLKSKRDAIETGVFGYDLTAGGDRATAAVLGRYTSGRFRKDYRWDDCVQMELGLQDSGVRAVDLAQDIGPNNTVIQFSPLGRYLDHRKGHHRRTKKLV